MKAEKYEEKKKEEEITRHHSEAVAIYLLLSTKSGFLNSMNVGFCQLALQGEDVTCGCFVLHHLSIKQYFSNIEVVRCQGRRV